MSKPNNCNKFKNFIYLDSLIILRFKLKKSYWLFKFNVSCSILGCSKIAIA